MSVVSRDSHSRICLFLLLARFRGTVPKHRSNLFYPILSSQIQNRPKRQPSALNTSRQNKSMQFGSCCWLPQNTYPPTTNFGSAKTDPVRFKWGFGEGFFGAFFSRFLNIQYLRGEMRLQNAHFYKQKGPCLKGPSNSGTEGLSQGTARQKRCCQKNVYNLCEYQDGAGTTPEPETGTVGTRFPGTEVGTVTVGTVFPGNRVIPLRL